MRIERILREAERREMFVVCHGRTVEVVSLVPGKWDEPLDALIGQRAKEIIPYLVYNGGHWCERCTSLSDRLVETYWGEKICAICALEVYDQMEKEGGWPSAAIPDTLPDLGAIPLPEGSEARVPYRNTPR